MTGVKAISCRLSPQYSSTAKSASTYCENESAKSSAFEMSKLAIKSVSISPPYSRGHACRRTRTTSSLQLDRVRAVEDVRGINYFYDEIPSGQLSSTPIRLRGISHLFLLSKATSSDSSLAILFCVSTSLLPWLRTAFATSGSNVAA